MAETRDLQAFKDKSRDEPKSFSLHMHGWFPLWNMISRGYTIGEWVPIAARREAWKHLLLSWEGLSLKGSQRQAPPLDAIYF